MTHKPWTNAAIIERAGGGRLMVPSPQMIKELELEVWIVSVSRSRQQTEVAVPWNGIAFGKTRERRDWRILAYSVEKLRGKILLEDAKALESL